MEGNYWSMNRVGRRSVLRGAGLGLTGLAGAALIGCGGGDDTPPTPRTGGQAGATIPTRTPAATAPAEDQPVPADQVRTPPGIYDGPVPPTPAEQNPGVNAKYGGTLLARYLDPPRMDLARTNSCTIYHTLSYVTNKLTVAKMGANADPFLVDIEPDLAESWEMSDGGATHTFNLRKDVKWHNKAPVNGRDFVAQDIVNTVRLYSGGSQADVFSMVDSIETPDDHTVVFKLDQPLADFPLMVAAWSWVYPSELVEDDDTRQEVAIGTGPFIQENWTRQEGSTFVRNPDYWGTDNMGRQLPYLDRVHAFVQNDTNAQRAGFQTHNFNEHYPRDDDDMAALFADLRETMVGYVTPRSRGANVNGFQFQMRNPTYQDERIRRAFSLAFDRNEYDLARNNGDNINPDGAYSNAWMPWPFLFDSYPTQKENGPWYQWDPAEASKLMQAAGYTPQNPLRTEMPSFYYRTELAQLVVPGINQNLPEVNITFRDLDNPTHVTMMSDRNFTDTIGFLVGPPGYSMDQWIWPFYHSEGSLNYGSIEDPVLDDLLVKQRAESNPDAQKDLWMQFWDRIHDQVYQAWFPEPLVRTAYHNYILNLRYHGMVGSYVCYASTQAKAIWLDDGAPMRRG
jgi:peptide/nickel transport system substrate-binding protein